MIFKRSSILFLITATLFAFLPVDLDGRGLRGGGAGGGRSISRPSAPSRPSSRPSRPSPNQRPASGWNLDSGILQPHQPANRSPSLSGTDRPSGSGLSDQRAAARNRAMTNPRLQPMFEGDQAARRSAARDRVNDAVRNAPRQLPADRSQIAAARVQTRANWGNNVRQSINPIRRNVLNRTWIDGNINRFPQRWFYWHRDRPGYWWWRWLTWSSLNRWIVYDWGDSFYYDYGYNPYYEDDVVFFNDEPVSSYDDYVASAEALANAPEPPANAETEWESLGTWALSTDPDHSESNMMLQLVLSQDGLVSGTYYHTGTGNTQRVRGSVDKDSQRLSFIIGETNTTILETGLANLTQDEAPLWVHFTTQGNTQTWLLARLESPEPIPDETTEPGSPANQ